MASRSFTPKDVESSFFEVQHQSDRKNHIKYNVEQQLEHKPFLAFLSKLSPVYLQDDVLIFKDSDQELVLDLEQLQADIHDGLKAEDQYGTFISIGSTKGQLKIQSLDEFDLAFLLDRDQLNISKLTSKSYVYHVQKGQEIVDARRFRENFSENVQEILTDIKLPTRLAHSGYNWPDFSGIRYNGPATTILLTWDPEGEAREISVDITPMLQLPAEDEQEIKRKITQKYQQIREEMPQEIFKFEGIYLFPNPISNQWELTTACYEATNLLPHLPHNTPFKSCIKMCKSMASLLSSMPTTAPRAQSTSVMKQVTDSLVEPNLQTPEIMKYGHAFLTPKIGGNHREMAKKAISINTAAMTHIALDLASRMHGAFMSTHNPDEQQRITIQLATNIFRYLSSEKYDVQHFFVDSQISLLSVATWARQEYDIQHLVNNIKTQCLLTAHFLTHWNIEELNQEVNQQVTEVPDRELQYIEDTFQVPAHFSGQGCNHTFGVILKLANALGNTMGGIITVYDPDAINIRREEVALWKSAFKEFATHCSLKENIHILDEESENHTIVLHVPRFPQRISLSSYKIQIDVVKCHSEAAQDTRRGMREIIAYQKQQYHTSPQIHYISENRQIKSTDISLQQSNYMGQNSGLREARNLTTNTEVGSTQPTEDASLNTRQTTQDGEISAKLHCMTLHDSDVVPIDNVSVIEANVELKRQKKLEWTTNKYDWARNLRQIKIDVASSAKELIDSEKSTFKLTSPATFIPSKESILHHHPRMELLLESVENNIGSEDALIMVCDSWPRRADIGISLNVPIHHVLDVVVFSRVGRVDIWCVVDSIDDTELSSIWQYAVKIGKSTKSTFHENSQNVHIQCHVYSFTNNQVHLCSKACPHTQNDEKNLMPVLACLLIRKKSHFRNCLGEDIDVHLTAKQMDVILQSAFTPIVLVEGPPGSGKTLLAFHICSKYKLHQVLYICATAAFQNYLHFQENCRPELVQNDHDMERLTKDENLENCKCIIIDDGHQLACSYRVWKTFLLVGKERSCQVYIFADSQYQNFNAVDSGAMKKCMEEMMRTGDASEHHLYDIHRNSRRVTSFLVASAADTHTSVTSEDMIGCSSAHEGLDVEVQYISNILEENESNGLLQLIQSQLSVGSLTGQDSIYTPRDIAVLVDTKHARQDVDILIAIFKQFLPFPVHSAGCFPIDGITLDTLDNFLGFDREVCICIVRRALGKQRLLKTGWKRQLQNPKYRTFVASRGISRVVFVVDVPICVEVARLMKMDMLPHVSSMRTHGEYDLGLSWMSAALLYSTRSGIHLLSKSGEKLPLEMDTVEIKKAGSVDCTPDGASLLLTDKGKPYSWTVFTRDTGMSYHVHATHRLRRQLPERDMQPIAARWAPDGEMVMALKEASSVHLQRYRVLDGDLLWEVEDVSRVVSPGKLSVCQQSGQILLADWTEVHVYSPAGKLLHCVPCPERLSFIYSVCAVRKDTWFTGHRDGSVRLWGVGDNAGHARVLANTGKSPVQGLALSGDKLLAVRTWTDSDKLIVYNVEGFLE